MPEYKEFYKARDIVKDILKRDFIGPVHRDEYFTDIPVQYYIMGKLYPQSESDEVLDLARNPFLESDVDSYDSTISLSHQRNPSSMGITCALKAGISSVRVKGGYAFYTPIPFSEAYKHGIETKKWNKEKRKPDLFWKRKEFSFDETFVFGSEKVLQPVELEGGMQLQAYTHFVFKDGERVVTIVLLNANQASNDHLGISSKCAFQAELIISGDDNEAIFANTNRQSQMTNDPELLELEMLYSDICCFGQGHGCSVIWDTKHEDPKWVASSWMPEYRLKQMMAAEISDTRVLNMKSLAYSADGEIIAFLKHFNQAYGNWILELENKAETIEERYQLSASANIQKCKSTFDRINHSIDLLEKSIHTDGFAIKAFHMANEAMLIQRKQTLKKNKKTVDDDNINWYPFQLAFILHELSSFIEPESEERNVVDLLWFPTGGGKTEAYLGITAFVIFLRRMRNQSDDGVTVLMRYTLRLLTLQQFERASMLIIACELLRQKYKLGGKEISIGLWVGGKLTPNNLVKARSSISKQQRGIDGTDEANPCQIQICPWCGNRITVNDYSVSMIENRMIIRCGNPKCSCHNFDNGLPMHIIDEAIYSHLPSFVVATVDKFAQIPLSDKPAALFGIRNGKKPPELIIQDELHLISGPLGTMTGIYEAAITKLCERNGIGAKVIASTATIRNAKNQILELYGRDFTQFPPQGISARDSYFAIQSSEEKKPARTYLGVMGIGTTATTTLIRINAALLFATRYLAACGFDDQVVDNYWTLTGYFNSLRELGGASTQILDDVQSRFNYLAKTKFVSLVPKINMNDTYDHIVELTSRMNNTEITEVIQDRLKRAFRDGNHSDVYDFVLASNMISVGVDVGRLGVMVVAGQPKTNAEYIQATSRVGRDNPGLVVASYVASKSRDRSHYEQFMKYHSALYRYVEATSLTPFADRARDRGLHALFVSLCRYMIPDLLENNCAVNFNPDSAEVHEIKRLILDYVEKVDPDEIEAVMNELDDISEEWNYATTGSLVYKSFRDEKELLKGDTDISNRFRTMNSMRNVDSQAGIFLLGR